MSKKPFNLAILSVAGYIGFQIIADISALKVFTLLGLSMTGGLLVYPFTFTLRDMIHKSLGKDVAKQVIISSGVINLFMAALFALLIVLPSDAHWFLQNEFSAVLGPVWRIVIASILAEVISQLADTEAYAYWIKKITTKYQWGRVLFSNLVSLPLDSIVFVGVAFAGVLPTPVLISMMLTQIAVKVILTLVSMPAIYLVKDGKNLED